MSINDENMIVDGILNCKKCDNQFTQQGKVEVFNREKEDSEKGLHVICENQKLSLDDDMVQNPNARRNSVKIEITCENCGEVFYLVIGQYKGQTLIGRENK